MVLEWGKPLSILSKGATQFDVLLKGIIFVFCGENVLRLRWAGVGAGVDTDQSS